MSRRRAKNMPTETNAAVETMGPAEAPPSGIQPREESEPTKPYVCPVCGATDGKIVINQLGYGVVSAIPGCRLCRDRMRH